MGMQDRIVDQHDIERGFGDKRVASAEAKAAESGHGDDLAGSVATQARQVRRVGERFIAAHPVICLGAALALGTAVGWWVKRK
jgi:hypothetical protein